MFNQFNVENKWKTFTDKIVSVSGELFVENNLDICGNLEVQGDVSFNSNVDICGNLSINGSSGDTGAVLTSQGTSNPTWIRPYFIKAKLETTIEDRNRGSRTDYQITGLTEQFTTGVFSYNSGADFSNNVWTCPHYGIYRISAQVYFLSGQNDRIDRAKMAIRKLPETGGSEFDIGSNQLDLYTSPGTRDTADNITPFMTILHEVQYGDKISLAVTWEVGGTPNGMDYLGSSTSDLTYITIEKVV